MSTPPSFITLTRTSTMLPNRNLHIHNNHILSYSHPPTLPCPHCLRRFRSRTGHTRHIQVKHADVLSSDGLTPPTLPTQSLLASSDDSDLDLEPQHSNEVPDLTPFSPLLHDMDVDHPNFDGDDTMFDTDIEPEVHRFTSLGRDRRVPEPPHITRTYHEKIDGESIS